MAVREKMIPLVIASGMVGGLGGVGSAVHSISEHERLLQKMDAVEVLDREQLERLVRVEEQLRLLTRGGEMATTPGPRAERPRGGEL